jgi:hypothetical protein
MRTHLRRLIATGICLLCFGCGDKALWQGVAPQPNPVPKVATDVGERMKAARQRVVELTRLSQQLPQKDDAAQRRTMRDVFDQTSKLLPLLMGPGADGQFRLQQRIVADCRNQMDRAGDRLAIEPTIDSGLRAVYNALVRVAQESFYTTDAITSRLSELRLRVDGLDRVRGPAHKSQSAEVVHLAAEIADRMVGVYEARLKRAEPQPAKCCTEVEMSPLSRSRSVTPAGGVNRVRWENFGCRARSVFGWNCWAV